ncbi:hypothetical protein [Luteirhabdus pelagi]|uniref:hypothetical protein n=1 Tax=Luteirhabdus pelagi TaxID=2792783 RepID=UPI00193ABE86|nr:hypothetical protein [Luteirhabdus pelagi]
MATIIEMIFTSNQITIRELTSKLIKIEKTEFDWTTEYKDPDNEAVWLKLKIGLNNEERNRPVMMQKNDYKIDFLIELVLTSKNLEQISTAAALMEYMESSESIEFRENLIDKLESHYSDLKNEISEFDLKRLNSIVNNSSLFDDTNRRTLVGKNDDSITSDWKFFKEVAERTERLITVANNV